MGTLFRCSITYHLLIFWCINVLLLCSKRFSFVNLLQLWPEKFQNKTNGVTPKRWIHFCNPDLSTIISKWIGTDDWVLHTEKLAELQKVIHVVCHIQLFIHSTCIARLFVIGHQILEWFLWLKWLGTGPLFGPAY